MNIYNNNFDFNKYKAFYAVSEFKSFSKAANNLHISQPAISYSIKELEQDLNTKLFIREKSNIILTDSGKKLKYYVEQAFDNLIKANNVLKEEANNYIGEVKIGIYSHIGVFFLPSIIKEFTKIYPNVKFTIISSAGELMRKKFKDREIDILISHYPKTSVDFNYTEKRLFSCESCFFANKEYYDSFMTNINEKKIAEYPLLLPMRGFITSNQLEKLFKRQDVILKSKIYLYTTEMTIALAKEGLGIGWCLKKSIEKELKDKELYEIPLDMTLPKMEFGIIYNDQCISETTKEFINYLLENTKNNY